MTVEKASLIFQIDGKCYAALTNGINLDWLVTVISSLYPDKQVKMVELLEGTYFEKLGNIKSTPTEGNETIN